MSLHVFNNYSTCMSEAEGRVRGGVCGGWQGKLPRFLHKANNDKAGWLILWSTM